MVAGRSCWFGLREVSEGNWDWSDGTSLEYSSWSPGEPSDDTGGNDCGGHYYAHERGTWNDLDCNTQLPYVCAMSNNDDSDDEDDDADDDESEDTPILDFLDTVDTANPYKSDEDFDRVDYGEETLFWFLIGSLIINQAL